MVRKIKAVMALLEANGWAHIRTRGDHRIFRKDGEPRSIPIPGSPSDDLAIGTLKSQAVFTTDYYSIFYR
jgi:predicted RNA binding protein YcfA (HicA-like mRNA interferase family)